MVKIQNIPVIDRPREKLISFGAEALTDTELLAVLIGSGTKGKTVLPLAKSVLDLLDQNLDEINHNKLIRIEGIGSVKACRIMAALEFSRRRFQPESIRIQDAKDVIPHITHIAFKKQENFLCISLNGANEIIKNRLVTIGLLNSTQIHPREIFADAISDRAASIILAHNHPSGILRPSKDDINVTTRMVKAGKILGISILDHIIISKGGFFSFKDEGVM